MKILRTKNTELRNTEENEVYSGMLGMTNTSTYFSSLLNQYSVGDTSLSAVFCAVEIISNACAELPIQIKSRNDNYDVEVKNHYLYDVIDNCRLTKFMLVKQMVSDMLLYGNGLSYIERDNRGKPMNIIYIPHDKYSISYNDLTGDMYYMIPMVSKRMVEPINVIHILKNSDNGCVGKGILDYARNTLNISKFTEKAVKDYFGSGCHVNGILSTDVSPLSKEKKKDIIKAWNEAHGPNGTGTAILEAGMKYQAVSSAAKDAQMLETRLFNLQEICRYFSISPILLGDLSKSSFATIEASLLEFVTHTLYPYIILIENELNRKLIPEKEKHDIFINLDANFILKSDKTSQANYLSTLCKSGIISIDEARQQLGLNSRGGTCNDLIIPFTNIDSNKVNKTEEDTTQENKNNLQKEDE